MAVEWKQDSVKEIREKKEAAAKTEAMNAQTQAAVMAFCSTSTEIVDEQALMMPDLFPTWEQVLAAAKQLPKDRIISKDGRLYRVVQPVTPLESQPPDGEGMLAVYRPIDQSHAGTPEDPIPWVYGMDCIAGTYYSYNGHTYKVADGGTMTPCVWPPDTAGMWQWVLIE